MATVFIAVIRWEAEKTNEKKATLEEDIVKFRWLDTHLKGAALADITAEKIQAIANKKFEEKVSPSTVNRYLALIRSVLRRAADRWKWLEQAPKIAFYKEPPPRLRFLRVEQLDILLSYLPEHQRDITLFALATSLRQSNVLHLTWDQIDLPRRIGWIHANQTKASNAIGTPLNQIACGVLQRQLGKHPQRIFTYRGKPIGQVNTKAWRKALVKAGIEDFRWHDLRHTWASWLAMNKATLLEIKELGAWKTLSMVMRYAHLSQDHLIGVSARLDDVMQNPIVGESTLSAHWAK